MLHTDGQYYFIATAAEWDRIELRRTRDLNALATAETKVLWREHGAGPMSAHIWAPEIHFIDGKWYIYFTASRKRRDLGSAAVRARERIARSLQGRMERTRPPRDRLGQLLARRHHVQTPRQALLRVDAARTHAGRGPRHQHLHRADGLAEVDHRQGHDADSPRVRMGKAQVRRQRRPGRADPQWQGVHDVLGERHRRQLLHGAADGVRRCGSARSRVVEEIHSSRCSRSSEANGQYGPGHNSFTTTRDGKTDLLVYHAREYRDIVGSELADPNRNTRAQVLRWKSDGTPDFGEPEADLGKVAPKPLYRDPLFDGAADPVIVYTGSYGRWYMLYTNRRANAQGDEGRGVGSRHAHRHCRIARCRRHVEIHRRSGHRIAGRVRRRKRDALGARRGAR